MRSNLLLIFIFILPLISFAQRFDSLPKEFHKHVFLGQERNIKNNLFFGLEMAELIQNRFNNYGPSNFTLFGGFRFKSPKLRFFGLQYLLVNAELGRDHLLDPNQVCCIEGDRSNLRGKIMYHRIYYDVYPITFKLIAIRQWQRHLITIKPIIGVGFGYSNWYFTNNEPGITNSAYDLKAFSFNLGIRIRTELLNLFFVDLPFYDLGILIAKNRSANGKVGSVEFTRPEFFTLTSMWCAGIRLDF